MLGWGGEHPGKGETSLIPHLRLDLVKDARPRDTDETRKPRKTEVSGSGNPYLVDEFVPEPRPKALPVREALYNYGVCGPSPEEATSEIGKVFYDELVETLANLIRRMGQAG